MYKRNCAKSGKKLERVYFGAAKVATPQSPAATAPL